MCYRIQARGKAIFIDELGVGPVATRVIMTGKPSYNDTTPASNDLKRLHTKTATEELADILKYS